jgi:hypothetical protein
MFCPSARHCRVYVPLAGLKPSGFHSNNPPSVDYQQLAVASRWHLGVSKFLFFVLQALLLAHFDAFLVLEALLVAYFDAFL